MHVVSMFFFAPSAFWLNHRTSIHCCRAAGQPLAHMEENYKDRLAEIKRSMTACKKATQRIRAPECISGGLKILIATLTFLKTPWGIIRAIAMSHCAKSKCMRIAGEWHNDKLKELAKQGMQLKPNLAHEPLNEKDPMVFAAKRKVAECKLCLMVLHHNLKGVVMPAALVLQEYRRLWGMGPHEQLLTQHLEQLMKKGRRNKWRRAWRHRWQLDVGALPQRASVTPVEIKEKVSTKHVKQQTKKMKPKL